MQTTPLAAAAVHEALQHARIGHTVVALGSVPSTMPVAAAAMDDGATRSGLVVTAEEQTAGRGRLGRSWQAPAGQALLMTVALKPPDLPQPLSRLPMLAAVAVVEAIARSAPALDARLAIKWPNDVLLQVPDASTQGDTVGKVAGILLESAFVGEEPAYALVGMGINVNQ
ncbi:MAG: biotin--[acetyl-CoA-carboxylase] ligase, partial [Caldilineaceae bacterium]|nr:biotin--[acetyl-CoA-carboxylase] ligase [Caldilineaceae bacterium]